MIPIVGPGEDGFGLEALAAQIIQREINFSQRRTAAEQTINVIKSRCKVVRRVVKYRRGAGVGEAIRPPPNPIEA